MMKADGGGSRNPAGMSDAAVQALDELLQARHDEVVRLAREASLHELLTAADVVRAYHTLEERRPSPVVSRTVPSPRSFYLPIIGAVMASIISLVTSYLVFRVGDPQTPVDSVVVTMGLVFGSISLAMLSALYVVARRISAGYEGRASKAARGERDRSPASTPDYVNISDLDEVSFLNQWLKLEDKLQRLAKVALSNEGKESGPDGPLQLGKVMGILLSRGVVDDPLESDFRRVLAIRNTVIHGESVPLHTLDEARTTMRSIEERLDKHHAI
ncbi:hypothetical protein [Paenarthrobacter sp. FR1]|uniref:hypothetical protein n=1 Tax=Paenarthrobacter sp. FR1 TaxID=3439548 RepID=UPI003DA4D49B